MKLLPYKTGSKSAQALADALGIKQLKREGGLIEVDTLINWGSSGCNRRIFANRQFNSFQAVLNASDKLEAFKILQGRVPLPHWTTSHQDASKALAEGWVDTIVCRTVLNGHSGAGIVLARKPEELAEAPLYTEYIRKTEEFRIHVGRHGVFFVQRKARKRDVPKEEVNWKIRNHQNGFIYANQNVIVDDDVCDDAITAVQALGLDFGAVDVIIGLDGKHYILEVNTACGLEGTTLEKYREQFADFL